MISREALRKQVHYCPVEGRFRWLVRKPGVTEVGKIAGTRDKVKGYRYITVSGAQEAEHRLAWRYMLDDVPEIIDHINGDPADNRWINLRAADRKLNAQNQRAASKNNKTGYLGVSLFQGRYYRATIRINGKIKLVGSFKTPEEAYEAYLAAKREHHKGCTI